LEAEDFIEPVSADACCVLLFDRLVKCEDVWMLEEEEEEEVGTKKKKERMCVCECVCEKEISKC